MQPDFWLRSLPDWCTGRSGELEKRLQTRYGSMLDKEMIQKEKTRIMRSYIAVCVAGMVLLLCVLIQWQQQRHDFTEALIRPDYGRQDVKISTTVTADYHNTKVKKEVELRIRPKALSQAQVKYRLERCEERLKKVILGKNSDSAQITQKLCLPLKEEKTGVVIQWDCFPEGLVNAKGEIDYLAVKKPTWVTLQAKLGLEQQYRTAEYQIRLIPVDENQFFEIALSGQIQQLSHDLSESVTGKELTLPERDEKGVSYRWRSGSLHGLFWVFVLTGAGICCIFRYRYRNVEENTVRYQEELKKNFPDVVSELVLLLNAGLVVTEAFERIGRRNDGSVNLLEHEIEAICQRVSMSNAPFSKALMEFARRTNVREIIRLASVVSDNLDKGSELCRKLEAESVLAWQNRKKGAEEEGKKIELQLTLPLIILLLVVVMITVAPVFLEMQ